ncbi:hypothetical protein SHKM778_41560 [Streptomyces sp. KM77-8]|uniref:Amine oxidase domain-containing protein n=1 Tax=Streptomyces haneummycinicus TaxID=3074435 RepID=A0AAT9HKV5_9ACTN
MLTPPPGARRIEGTRPTTAVVGGGIAGLAAATALAERGVAVTLYEREPFLGGRAGGWPTRLADGTRATMSRGFHAFFRQYYNLRGLLRRTDPGLERLTGLPDYPLWHSDGLRDGFRHVPRTPPWSALGFAALSPSFRLRDLRRMSLPAALPLFDVRVPDVYARLDGVSAHDFLDAVGFPPGARHLAFEVFSRSFFADPRRLSAAEMVLMFHIYFLGSAEGLLFDVPAAPYPAALWEPLAGYLGRHGARIRTGTAVEHLAPTGGGGYEVATTEEEARHDTVVLALDARDCAGWWPAPAGWATARGGNGSRRCATPRRSSSAACGWTGPWHPTGPRSWAPAATPASTTSACWSATRTRRHAGPPAPAAPWSNSTRTRGIPGTPTRPGRRR